jgi:curli biogenesis system outer membrane secretion channel CsgG
MTRIAKTISQLAGRTTVEARGGVRSSSWQPPSRRWRDARRKPTGLEPQSVASAGTPYQGPKSTLVVGKFDNRSSYPRGLFSDGVDRLGGQAKGILVTHLQQTGRFTVVERDNLEEITREAAIKGQEQQQLKGADFVITGDVAEFGRKEVGDVQLLLPQVRSAVGAPGA